MARSEAFIGVRPERVFEQLADGWAYARWVVGAKEVRHADDDWPAAGSRIHPTVRLGPVNSQGTTIVEAVTPPWRLTLRATAGLAGAAVVDLRLRPEGRGTRVAMVEEPVHRLAALNPLVHLALGARNARSLQRLRALAESGAG